VSVFDPLTVEETERIDATLSSFDDADFDRIKAIEVETNHDVKACELFLRRTLGLLQPERIHFGVTSADVNNLAYARLIRRYRDEHQLPQLRALVSVLADRAEAWAAVPFPARTHGQPASPTTAGKEMAVFLTRLVRHGRALEAHRFRGKVNGATGTYASFATAAPDIDWRTFSREFVERQGLEWSDCTTQIESYDSVAEYLDRTARINAIVLDLDLDLWQYISHGEIVQRAVEGEVGSSAMPHKVNPIRFESSEGNLTLSNALLHAIGDKLTQSRMQRDLSGSTVARNLGTALAYSYLAVDQTLRGLDRIDIDRDAARAHVDDHPEVLAEAIQTVLRAEGVNDPYDVLKGLTRGRVTTLDELRYWIDGLDIGNDVRRRLKALEPTTYVGLAETIARGAVADARTWLNA
jgi:adenylosuccinate lyase